MDHVNHRWEQWQPFDGERSRKRCKICGVWTAVVWAPRQGGGHAGWVRKWFRGEHARTDIRVRWPTCQVQP